MMSPLILQTIWTLRLAMYPLPTRLCHIATSVFAYSGMKIGVAGGRDLIMYSKPTALGVECAFMWHTSLNVCLLICDVEDMKRLAFVSTKCAHRLGEKESLGKVNKLKYGKYVDAWLETDDAKMRPNETYRQKVYATEKNFPETDVATLVESMFNAFGLKIVADKEGNISTYYMRDILRDNEVIDENMRVRNVQVTYSKVKGVRLTYGGNEDDTAYNYKDYDKDTVVISNYKDLVLKNLSAYDKRLYVNSTTGNKYRIKIDEDAEKEGNEEELNPVLFEVGQFADYVMGEDSEDAEELKISFTPLIENDVAYRKERSFRDETTQCLSLYIDGATVKEPRERTRRLMGDMEKNFFIFNGHNWWVDFHQNLNIYFSEEQEENPIINHDCGFMLGVMRGPGNDSGRPVIKIEDYDGNGNDAWVTVEDEYAFTSDSIDAYGNYYDYNGESDNPVGSGNNQGVVGLEDTISLKTHITTAQELGLKNPDGTDVDWNIDAQAAKRGLADRFMSEYMYFLLHRKTVSMDVDTTLSQLISLSWFKQLRISDTVGRLKSRKYTLTNSGVSDMSIELYTIN